jgi:hypothetical protein
MQLVINTFFNMWWKINVLKKLAFLKAKTIWWSKYKNKNILAPCIYFVWNTLKFYIVSGFDLFEMCFSSSGRDLSKSGCQKSWNVELTLSKHEIKLVAKNKRNDICSSFIRNKSFRVSSTLFHAINRLKHCKNRIRYQHEILNTN